MRTDDPDACMEGREEGLNTWGHVNRIHDADMVGRVGSRTNEVVRVLKIITTIFIPLSFLAGG